MICGAPSLAPVETCANEPDGHYFHPLRVGRRPVTGPVGMTES
jgi:hypothetical protein